MVLHVLLTVVIPLGLDLYLPVPESNPLTAEKIALGRQLFDDPRLSRDGSIACSTCHDPALSFSDGRRLSVGINGRVGTRNVPAIINRGYGRAFFWDGRTTTLEEQVLRPIEAENEMDATVEDAAKRVGLTPREMADALASYVRSILSGNSRFDRYVNGERDALTNQELEGLQIFRGKGRCTACHLGPTLTDERFHNTGVAWQPDTGDFRDAGRFLVTSHETDRGAFKTPTLRDVARTAPYMHDGGLATLEEVVAFYDAGGRLSPNLDQDIRPLHLTGDEKRALVAFLRALTGQPAGGIRGTSHLPARRSPCGPRGPVRGAGYLPTGCVGGLQRVRHPCCSSPVKLRRNATRASFSS